MVKMIRFIAMLCMCMMLSGVLLAGKDLVLKVKGMTCPFCTNSLKNALESQPYIQAVKTIDLEQGRVEVTIKNDVSDSPQTLESKLRTVVKKATFILDGIEQVTK